MRRVKKRLFAGYQKALSAFGGHGLGRFRFIKKLDRGLRRALKRRNAAVLGHQMFLDDFDSLNLSLEGVHEPFSTQVLATLTQGGDVVIDVGANIGYFTLLFARAVGPSGRVFAFEPEPVNFSLLARNVEVNGYQGRVIVFQQAASDTSGWAPLAVSELNRGLNRLWQGPAGSTTVQVEKIVPDDDSSLFERPVNLIKIDVEGWEDHVLRGMKRLLQRNPQASIFTEFMPGYLVEAGSDPGEFLHRLAAHGPQLFWLDDASQRLKRVSSLDWQSHPELCGNLLSLGSSSSISNLPVT